MGRTLVASTLKVELEMNHTLVASMLKLERSSPQRFVGADWLSDG